MAHPPRILVPSDFSDHSDAAVEYAIGLATRINARVELLHAYGVPRHSLTPYDVSLPREALVAVRDAAARKLLDIEAKVRDAGIDVEGHLAEAAPSSAIADFASRLDADWIVMGTRGHSGLKHVLLGSVAERTLRTARCPLVTVRQHREDWANLRLRTILVPCDFSVAAKRALDVAAILATSTDAAHIQLIHAYQIPSALGLGRSFAETRVLKEWTEKLRNDLTSLVEPWVARGLSASCVLQQGRPEDVILEIAKSSEPDMIVMGTHGRTGLPRVAAGSVAERVVREAPCPTVTVKP